MKVGMLMWATAILGGAFALLLAGHAAAYTNITVTSIDADTTWDVAGSPYYIYGSLTVQANATLTVHAGVQVLSANNQGLIEILGGLDVQRSGSTYVTFGRQGGGVARWEGIFLNRSALNVTLAGPYLDWPKIGLQIVSPAARVNVTSISMRNVGVLAIDVWNPGPNVTIGGVYVESGGAGLRMAGITNWTLNGWEVSAAGVGFELDNSSGLTITGSRFASSDSFGMVWDNVHWSTMRGGRVDIGYFSRSNGLHFTNCGNLSFSDMIIRSEMSQNAQWNNVYHSNISNTTLYHGLGGTYTFELYGGAFNSVNNSSLLGGTVSLGLHNSHDFVARNNTMRGGIHVRGDRAYLAGNNITHFASVIDIGAQGGLFEYNRIWNSTTQCVFFNLVSTSNNVFRYNVIDHCATGILVAQNTGGPSNLIYGNEFYNNTVSGDSSNSAAAGATWYDPVALRGNFWDNYRGPDEDFDGIGDWPYNLTGGNRSDPYPLIGPPWNLAPVARLWVPAEVDEDVALFLNGANSTDDVAIVRATWRITMGNQTSLVNGLTPQHTFADAGLAVLRLAVYDKWNRSSAAYANITVHDKTPPVLWPHALFTARQNEAFNLSLNVTDNDWRWPAGAVINWTITGGWANEQFQYSTGAPVLALAMATAGNYTVLVRATDAEGNEANRTYLLDIRDSTPPVCQFVVGANATVFEGDLVAVTLADCTDNDPAFPGPTSFDLSLLAPGGSLVLSTAQPAYSALLTTLGSYTVRARVQDGAGNIVTFNATLLVNDRYPPQWDAPAGPLSTTDLERLSLSAASATDPSGVTSIEWWDGGERLAVGPIASLSFPVPGTHTLRVVLTDPFNHTSQYFIEVFVLDTTPPSLLNGAFSAKRELAQGEMLVLDAAGNVSDLDPAYPGSDAFAWGSDASDARFVGGLSSARVSVSFPSAGSFTLTFRARDPTGNELVVPIEVHVRDSQPPLLLQPTFAEPRTIGYNETISLDATNLFEDNDPRFVQTASFAWTALSGAPNWQSQLDRPAVSAKFAAMGDFTLRLEVRDAAGNAEPVDILVHVVDRTAPGNVKIVVQPSGSVAAGVAVAFESTAFDVSPLTFDWAFGDGQSAPGPTATHAFAQPGVFRVVVTVTDAAGNKAIQSVAVVVEEVQGPGGGGQNNTTAPPATSPGFGAFEGALAIAAAVVTMALLRRRRAM